MSPHKLSSNRLSVSLCSSTNPMHFARIAAASVALALPAMAVAQPSINWYTIDGGGGTSTGGSFTISGTIGQPDAGAPMTGGSFTLTGGFWAGITTVALACSLADLVGGDGNPPADGSLDGNDFQAFLNAFGAGDSLADIVGGDGNPPGGDGADGNDFQAFLNAFGAGC